jgi:Ser/Thr protein kinase RdoA (MazF antagonist)
MDGLAEHLHDAYDVTVIGLAQLALGVHRVRLEGGDDWVARVFPAHRAIASAQHDATVLRRLETAGFPAERLAAEQEPVTVFDDRPVLVTRFIHGEHPRGGRAWAILGALLGAMHSVAADWASPAGAWHHLADGTPRDEIAAATTLLERIRADVPARQRTDIETLLHELQGLDDGDDLRHALVHPDFVPVNAIDDDNADEDQPGRGVVVIDWTGAGRGPRIWSLAFTLWAGGARDLKVVDLIVSRYRRRITPEPEELERLAAVIRGRPLLLDCWRVAHQGYPASKVVAYLPELHRLSELIAERARRAFTH